MGDRVLQRHFRRDRRLVPRNSVGLGNSVGSTFRTFCPPAYDLQATTPPYHRLTADQRHKAVRQRLHEAHDRILFCLRQAEAPTCSCSCCRSTPARASMSCLHRHRGAGSAAGRRACCRNARSLSGSGNIHYAHRPSRRPDRAACRRCEASAPELRLVVRRQLEPSRIHRGGLAEQMTLAEKMPTPPSTNDALPDWRHSPTRRADFPHNKAASGWRACRYCWR